MIFLHIGLHKVGSSTIQRFATEKADLLAAHGVHYPAVARGEADAHHLLVMAMREPGSTDALEEAAALVAARPDDTFFFSSEGLSTLRPPHIRQVVTALGRQHQIRVLLYVRNTVDTTVSAYNQTAKRGQRLTSFDQFYTLRANGRETLGHVQHWGERVGFDSLRVRTIEPSALVGGDLLTDLCSALELNDAAVAALAPASFDATNTRVPWEAAEYVRAFTLRTAALLAALDPAARSGMVGREGPLRRIIRTIDAQGNHIEAIRFGEMTDVCVEAAMAAGAGAPAQYLTPEQSAHLDARYREQLAEIAALVPDAKLDHAPPKPLPPRPCEPTLDTVAPAVRAAMQAAVEERFATSDLPQPLRDIFYAMRGEVSGYAAGECPGPARAGDHRPGRA